MLLRMCLVFGLLYTLTLPPAVSALIPDPHAIDAYIRHEMQQDNVPGAAVVIVQGTEIVYAHGFGTAGDSRPVTPDTAFVLGSISKSFTAMAVLQLVEAGTLELDAPVQRYLPEFRVADPLVSTQITLRHLLNQTSGIPSGAPRAQTTGATLADHVAALQNVTLAHAPGAAHLYASPNYQVLGRVVEVASGQDFGAYITDHIFAPLGMTHSYTDLSGAPPDALAQGHQYWFGIARPAAIGHETDRLPTAALTASASDVGHYLIALLNDGTYDQAQLLSSESMQTLFDPAAPTDEGYAYAMGWRVGQINAHPAIHHGGIVAHFRGKLVLLPDQGYGVAVLTNISSVVGAPTSHRMADGVATILTGAEPQPATLPLRYLLLGIAAGMGVLTLHQLRAIVGLLRWQRALEGDIAKGRSVSNMIIGEMVSIAISAAVLAFLPRQVGLTWVALLEQVPDIGWWLLLMLPTGMGISVVRLSMLRQCYARTIVRAAQQHSGNG